MQRLEPWPAGDGGITVERPKSRLSKSRLSKSASSVGGVKGGVNGGVKGVVKEGAIPATKLGLASPHER